MKAAIEKAKLAGFKFPQTTIGHTGTWHNTSDGFRAWIDVVSIHELIFGTDFVDKLVVEGSRNPLRPKELDTTICTNIQCKDNTYDLPNEYTRNCQSVTIDRALASCVKSTEGNAADYHRTQLANLKDVEKLKEYIRGLAK